MKCRRQKPLSAFFFEYLITNSDSLNDSLTYPDASFKIHPIISEQQAREKEQTLSTFPMEMSS